MLLYNNFFPADVAALTSDRAVDFQLDKTQCSLSDAQKEFLSSQLNISLPEPVIIRQVHGNRIIVADKNFPQRGSVLEEADGLITQEPYLPLTVRTADCLPVFLYDQQRKGIGLIHAGWRGVQKNIVGRAVGLMREQWRSDPKNIKAAFGPSIRGCCYEVGKEFEDYFPGQLISRESRCYLDLFQVCYAQLMDSGVKKGNISDCGVCTCCDQNYFSFRREGQLAGRMISLIMLKEQL